MLQWLDLELYRTSSINFFIIPHSLDVVISIYSGRASKVNYNTCSTFHELISTSNYILCQDAYLSQAPCTLQLSSISQTCMAAPPPSTKRSFPTCLFTLKPLTLNQRQPACKRQAGHERQVQRRRSLRLQRVLQVGLHALSGC